MSIDNGLFKDTTVRDWLWFIIVIFSVGVAWGSFVFHTGDEDIHMTYEEQTDKFVPRREFNTYKEDVIEKIDKRLDRIEGALGTLPKEKGEQ